MVNRIICLMRAIKMFNCSFNPNMMGGAMHAWLLRLEIVAQQSMKQTPFMQVL